ncbi:MAG: aspartate--tRNA ligase [Bacillota bacterium]|nr:aspartate--tRNA ligase [Bacillota bacterium]
MKYKAPRGTRDILPEEAKNWQYLETRFREFCDLYGFGEIRTPIFEQTELFARSVGEESDIVSKEMYSFKDRSGRELTLRPELTAAVARAYLEHNLKEVPQPVKLYYYGPMFRYDRPQAGRYRQFHQFGLEIFGAAHAAADTEIITFCYNLFKSLQIEHLSIELNSVGCPVCRPGYREVLVPYLEKLEEGLCSDCRRRYKVNPMRVLDCKEESCQTRVNDAPRMIDHLCEECDSHFKTLRALLDKLQVPYNLNTSLVRGLDYYTRTAFEITAGGMGAQASLCGGGRYDYLVEHLGGPATPGVGVAFGVERILMAMNWDKNQPAIGEHLFIATAGENLEGEALLLAGEVRSRGIAAETDLLERSLKAQMKLAGKQGFGRVIIIGENEINKGRVTLRDMDSGEQKEIDRNALPGNLSGESEQSATTLKRQGSAEVSLPSPGLNTTKTHYCGFLSKEHVGLAVKLTGWVGRRRDHGGLIFIDLRDRSGVVQLVFDQQMGTEIFNKVESLRGEFVVAVDGEVIMRTEENINPALPTGEIEVHVSRMDILNASKTPPFYIENDLNVDENLRLRYRYLDLRRPEMFKRLELRHRAVKLVREYLDKFDFLEIETPMLTRSTPEGARDFLVPSRLQPGAFYALPQSPQLFKQLLMVSGVERYFQVVRCFRDEDLRADRQPEFTQIDIETSFFGSENLFALIEGMISLLWKEILGVEVPRPFMRIPYTEAMNRFGSDKPDLRFGMELTDINDLAAESDFKVFKSALEDGGSVKGLCVPESKQFSRKDLDDLTLLARQLGAKGLAWVFVGEEGWRSPISKFFSDQLMSQITEAMKAKPGDLLLFVADQWETCCEVLGQLRNRLSPKEKPGEPHFLWVVDFPLFHYNDDEERYDSAHHPFTAPQADDLDLLDRDPLAVKAQAYDLVLNGVEIGGGSTRIHNNVVQSKIFKLLGLSEKESVEKFGFLLEALSYGAPPHGGIALGLDRMISLLTGDDSIRQVIPFPKTATASCLMTGAPSPVAEDQLEELKIALQPEDEEE